MSRKMLTSLMCWISFFVSPALIKTQALNSKGADHSQVKQWDNEISAVHMKNHQTLGPGANSRPVVVNCHSDFWEVVVQADLFGTGLLLDGRHLHLGAEQQKVPSVCRAVPSGPTQFTIQARLTDCGTVKLPAIEEKIIYANVLVYSPEPSPEGLLRLDEAAIPVQCHYNKYYSVKTPDLLPIWESYIVHATTESQIVFNMRLMTENWEFERDSPLYYVGDPINFEVSSILGNHKSLRVFVDHCVATATPDPEAALRYDFIDHNGCFADAYLTNSSARFFKRTKDHKIQFQMDAFLFHQQNSNQIYITCDLTAVPSVVSVKSKHRACSLFDNRWRSADGNDEDCLSCAVPYPVKKSATKTASAAQNRVQSQQKVTSREHSHNIPTQQPATYLHVRKTPYQNVHATPQSSTDLMKEEKRKGTLKVGPLIILHSPRASL